MIAAATHPQAPVAPVAHPTDRHRRVAFNRLRAKRSGWPATLEEAEQLPLLRSQIQALATGLAENEAARERRRAAAPEAAEGWKPFRPKPHRMHLPRLVFDWRRIASGDGDED